MKEPSEAAPPLTCTSTLARLHANTYRIHNVPISKLYSLFGSTNMHRVFSCIDLLLTDYQYFYYFCTYRSHLLHIRDEERKISEEVDDEGVYLAHDGRVLSKLPHDSAVCIFCCGGMRLTRLPRNSSSLAGRRGRN